MAGRTTGATRSGASITSFAIGDGIAAGRTGEAAVGRGRRGAGWCRCCGGIGDAIGLGIGGDGLIGVGAAASAGCAGSGGGASRSGGGGASAIGGGAGVATGNGSGASTARSIIAPAPSISCTVIGGSGGTTRPTPDTNPASNVATSKAATDTVHGKPMLSGCQSFRRMSERFASAMIDVFGTAMRYAFSIGASNPRP